MFSSFEAKIWRYHSISGGIHGVVGDNQLEEELIWGEVKDSQYPIAAVERTDKWHVAEPKIVKQSAESLKKSGWIPVIPLPDSITAIKAADAINKFRDGKPLQGLAGIFDLAYFLEK